MDKRKYMEIISRKYFLISNKVTGWIDKWIKNDMEKAIKKHYMIYHTEPTEKDVKDIKKEIVMKKGLFIIFVLVLLSIVFIR